MMFLGSAKNKNSALFVSLRCRFILATGGLRIIRVSVICGFKSDPHLPARHVFAILFSERIEARICSVRILRPTENDLLSMCNSEGRMCWACQAKRLAVLRDRCNRFPLPEALQSVSPQSNASV